MVLLLLLGGDKVSHLMGDFAKGIKSFKRSMAEDDDASMACDKPTGTVSEPSPESSSTNTARRTISLHTQG